MANSVISVGELAPGMKVSILEWKKNKDESFETGDTGIDGFIGTLTKVISNQNNEEFCGDVLTVKAVQIPYVIVRLDRLVDTPGDMPIKIDSRKCVFMELSDQFIEASKRPVMPEFTDMMNALMGMVGKRRRPSSGSSDEPTA